jgi:hypothetical protein
MTRTPWRAIPVLLVLASLSLLSTERRVESVPLYAARTGLMCQSCHFDPNGGGPRNEFGFAFARNRHSLTPEDSTSAFHDLALVNRVGDAMPLYIGLNHRFMLFTNQYKSEDSLARLGFFNMENAVHLTFQPHPRLTLVYSFDAFSTGPSNAVRQKEGFAMISGFPWDGYIKAGRFRNPYGLRLDDHTVATRTGFLDFSTQQSFLPYDPRFPDMGVELGADRGGLFGRAAFTNGEADVLGGQYANAKSIKIGYNHPYYQGALSFYDNYNKESVSGLKRETRWGYYGLTHWKSAALIGEVGAGTNEAEPAPGLATGPKTNLLAGYVEGDYAPSHTTNLRVRWDHEVLDKSSDAARDASTHDRYALEGEWVPVPFAELRGAVRRIKHKDDAAFGYPDETQAFLQLHLSY